MNANPWASPKSREIRRVLVSLDERIASACDIEPDAGQDPHIVTLRHAEIATLRAHVYLHGQRAGTYGIFYEFPHPVPGILESEENLPKPSMLPPTIITAPTSETARPKVLASLALHFDA